ncbi:hypothetical protein KKB18_10280, partial [bacterium]|nr:hypothetical protein [bacterium]
CRCGCLWKIHDSWSGEGSNKISKSQIGEIAIKLKTMTDKLSRKSLEENYVKEGNQKERICIAFIGGYRND